MSGEHPIYLSVAITPLEKDMYTQYRGHAVASCAGVGYVTAEVPPGMSFESVGNSVVRMALQRLADKEKEQSDE